MEESLIKSNFIGRDGFIWWMGQVAPFNEEEIDGENWGRRYRVRIYGYHPDNETLLSNDDLPYAQVMLPTTAGTGGAGVGQPPRLSGGDTVFGFFLDGNDSQQPIIMGSLPRTAESSTSSAYTIPFMPFTGHDDRIEPPNESVSYNDETNESRFGSQVNPRQVSSNKLKPGEVTAHSAIGRKEIPANTCGDSSFDGIRAEIENLVKWLQEKSADVNEAKRKISDTAEVIRSYLNWIVGKMQEEMYNFLVGDPPRTEPGILPRAIQALYTTVYGTVYAATGNHAAAHTAGYKSNEVLILPVQLLEKAIICVTNTVMDGILSIIVSLLESFVENVINFTVCSAEQFVGALISSVINKVESAMQSALDGVLGVLNIAFSVTDFMMGVIDTIDSLGGILDCGQNDKSKCSNIVKEWTVGVGEKETPSLINNLNNTMSHVQNLASTGQDIFDQISNAETQYEQILATMDIFNGNTLVSDVKGIFGSCYTGPPLNCGPAKIKIFGGGNFDIPAIAEPIFSNAVERNELIQGVEKTAKIIGVSIKQSGSGYEFPPFIDISDPCDVGYGAKARATINDEGEVTSIYLVSVGQDYPVRDSDVSKYGVSGVTVQKPGNNYSDGDTGFDNLGNEYALNIVNGSITAAFPINKIEASDYPTIRVNTKTGSGAVLKAKFSPIEDISDGQLRRQIDCVI